MFARALIVLLIAINLGVALWWLLRAEPSASSAAPPPPGVPRLQLLSEARPLAAAAVASSTQAAGPVQTAPTTAPNQCFSFGPFATAAALRKASTHLQPQLARIRTRGATPAPPPRGYTVLLPPFASRELAQAQVDRIKAAGFDDLLLINDGNDANGITLGRYGSLASAQRRQASLQAAGFAAQLQPIGEPALPAWLDIEVRDGLDIAQLRADSGAAQSPALDCARLRY